MKLSVKITNIPKICLSGIPDDDIKHHLSFVVYQKNWEFVDDFIIDGISYKLVKCNNSYELGREMEYEYTDGSIRQVFDVVFTTHFNGFTWVKSKPNTTNSNIIYGIIVKYLTERGII